VAALSLKSAASLAAERPLKVGEALGILRDAASALAACHAAGAVHGAVCAENIVLDEAGVARLCRDTLAPPRESPEQRRGGRADPRSDVYGLGAAIADLLAGAGPLPTPFERLLATMMAEEPRERYQSMDEVLTALEACELMTGLRAFRPGREPDRVRPRQLYGTVVVLALLILALALFVLLGETRGRGKRPGAESDEQFKALLDRMARPGPKPAAPRTP